MAGEKDINIKQNEIRREVKRKQAIGKGAAKKTEEKENVRFDRHVIAKFSDGVEDAIKAHFDENPEQPLTTWFFKNLMKQGKMVLSAPAPYGDIKVTFDDLECGLRIWSAKVFTSGGFGVEFKKVGGRDGKPARVMVN